MWRDIFRTYRPSWPQTLVFMGAVFLSTGLMLFRWFVIESHTLGQLCETGQGPWWCWIRHGIIQIFVREGFGFSSLIAALVGFTLNNRHLAMMAMLLGAAGLVLYNVNFATLGVVVGFIQLARPRTTPIQTKP
ncbi:MAG: hypothetical protein R3E60_01040 [Alphaproteobacteria bacterium]